MGKHPIIRKDPTIEVFLVQVKCAIVADIKVFFMGGKDSLISDNMCIL